jgi:hypothetical protein
MFGKKTIDKDIYYQKINNFFNRIESDLKLPVIIAAHPKALKYKEYNYFNSRKVIFNETDKLVSHASFVMAHHSTSVFFTAMYRKKIIFLVFDEFIHTFHSEYEIIKMYANMLNGNIIFLDNVTSIGLPDKVLSEEQRNTILFKYLTSEETKNTQSVQIFLNFIKELRT